MEAIVFNHIVEKKHKDAVSLSEFFKYLTTEGHQVEGEHHIFSYGLGENKDEIQDNLKDFENSFVAAKKAKLIAKNTTNVGYSDCINLPNTLTYEQIERLSRKLHKLSPDVSSVFVLHEENRKGDKHLHLHHIRLARSNNALIRIDEQNRCGLVKGTKDALKTFYIEEGYSIRENMHAGIFVGERARHFLKSIAAIEAINLEFNDIKEGVNALMRSSSFFKKVSRNDIDGINIESQNLLLACKEKAEILARKKGLLSRVKYEEPVEFELKREAEIAERHAKSDRMDLERERLEAAKELEKAAYLRDLKAKYEEPQFKKYGFEEGFDESEVNDLSEEMQRQIEEQQIRALENLKRMQYEAANEKPEIERGIRR